MCLVTGFQPPLTVATDRNYTGALECWDKSVSAEKAAKCSLACRYHDAPSPRANAPSPLYWGKLSGAGACWTWRTARWSPHKAGVLASPEHTAPYGSADVQSSWEAAKDNKKMWQMTPSAWQRQELCIPMCSHPRSHWQGGAKLNKQPRCISGQSIPFNAKLKRDRSCYLLWTLSSTFSVEKAFTSKSTPQVCQRERGQLWNQDQNICRCFRIFLHIRNWQTPASCKLSWPPTTVTDIPDNCVGISTCSTVLLINEA